MSLYRFELRGLLKPLPYFRRKVFSRDEPRARAIQWLNRQDASDYRMGLRRDSLPLLRVTDYRHLNPSERQVKRIAKRWTNLRDEMESALGSLLGSGHLPVPTLKASLAVD